MRPDKKMYIRSKRRNKYWLVPVMALCFAGVLSFVVAWAWQGYQQSLQDPNAPFVPNIPSSSSSSSSSEDQGTSEEPVSESSSEPEEPAWVPEYGVPIPESERVDRSYFDDAAFVGDSLTTGLQLYETAPNSAIYAQTGLSVFKISTKEFVKMDDGSTVTVVEALRRTQPKKIYIMLGTNEAGQIAVSSYVNSMSSFLDEVKEACPNSIIYLQTLFPVTKDRSENSLTTLAAIQEFNVEIKKLAQEKQLYLVDTYSAPGFTDSEGYLPEEASPVDGVHFGAAYYSKWLDYLRTHTVPEE